MSIRIRTLCRALRLSPERVEQMIARGVFTPEAATTPGKAREWSLRDVLALILFERLYSFGMPHIEAQSLAYLISPQLHCGKMLVAWPDPRHNNGGWTHEIVHARELGWFLDKNVIVAAAIINIDAVDKLASKAIDAASEAESN